MSGLTEAQIETQLANVSTAINTVLTTGSLTDHEVSELKITKSNMLGQLIKLQESLQTQLAQIPAVAVHHEATFVNAFGTDSSEHRGDILT